MAYETYKKAVREYAKKGESTIRTNKQGQISIHKALRDKLKSKYVMFLWDKQRGWVGIKAVNEYEDNGFAMKERDGTVQARSFLSFIGYDYSKNKTIPAWWNEVEQIIECDITK